jgi:Fe2+ or Zn2+ uptake regulation protein
MSSKPYEKITTLLEVISEAEKKRLLKILSEELGEKVTKKQTAKSKVIPHEKAYKMVIASVKESNKVPIEVVAGFLKVSIQTIYNNSNIFRVSGIVKVLNEKRGDKTISRAHGRNTVYSAAMLLRLRKFMLRERLTSLNAVKKRVSVDPHFKERLSKIRWNKDLKS